MSRIIEIRPHKGGWQCFEAPGVAPHWTSKNAQEQAIHYAKERAKTEGAEIRILNESGQVAETLRFKDGEFQSVAVTGTGPR